MSFKRLNRKYMIGLIALSMLGLNACDNSSENESNISDNANAVTDGQPVNAPLYNAIVAIYNTQRNQIAGTGTLVHPKYVLTSSNIVHTGACENGIKKLFESNSAIGFGNTLSEITSNLHPIKKYHIGCNFTLIELETPVSETEAYPLQLISPDEAVTRNQLVNETIRFDSVGFNSLKGSDDYGIKFQTKVSALDICSESNKDSINGCLYSSDKTTIPFGTLYSRFSLGTAKLGDGAPVFVTTDTFPGIAVAAVANAATAINNDNYSSRNDTLIQDRFGEIRVSVPEVITYQETRFQASKTEIQENKCSGEHLAACALQYPAKSNCFISRYNKWECCGDDADCAKRKSEIYKATSDELQENKCSDEHLAACANQYPVNYACYISSKASWECAENCDGHEKCTQICKYGNSKSDAKGSRKVCVNNEWQDDAYPVVSAGPATAPAYNGVVAIYNTKEEKLETPAVLIHPNWALALDYAFRYAIDTNYYRYYPDNSYKVISTGNTMDELKSSQHKIKKIYYGSDVNSRFTGLALIELESPVPETEAYPLPLISPHNLITNAQLSSQTFLTTAVGFGPAPKDEKLKQSVGVEHRGTKYQITMPALDACSHTDKGTQDGTDCTYSDVKYPVGLLYSRFSLADPESGTGSPVFITTEEFPGVAVAAIAYIERINKNGDNFMTRYDKLVQDNVYKSYTNTDFIKEIAPEVYTYHEDRKAASPTEIESKTCSAEHLAMCATQYPDKDHECFVMLRQNLDKSYENIWGCCEGKGCAAAKN